LPPKSADKTATPSHRNSVTVQSFAAQIYKKEENEKEKKNKKKKSKETRVLW
jgi:hypothetical protein